MRSSSATTRPYGSTTAVMPSLPARSSQRRVSIARIRPMSRCWRAPSPRANQASFVMMTSTPAPSRTMPPSWWGTPTRSRCRRRGAGAVRAAGPGPARCWRAAAGPAGRTRPVEPGRGLDQGPALAERDQHVLVVASEELPVRRSRRRRCSTRPAPRAAADQERARRRASPGRARAEGRPGRPRASKPDQGPLGPHDQVGRGRHPGEAEPRELEVDVELLRGETARRRGRRCPAPAGPCGRRAPRGGPPRRPQPGAPTSASASSGGRRRARPAAGAGSPRRAARHERPARSAAATAVSRLSPVTPTRSASWPDRHLEPGVAERAPREGEVAGRAQVLDRPPRAAAGPQRARARAPPAAGGRRRQAPHRREDRQQEGVERPEPGTEQARVGEAQRQPGDVEREEAEREGGADPEGGAGRPARAASANGTASARVSGHQPAGGSAAASTTPAAAASRAAITTAPSRPAGRQQRRAHERVVDADVLVAGVRAAAAGADPVEGGDAERGGEVAVRAAAHDRAVEVEAPARGDRRARSNRARLPGVGSIGGRLSPPATSTRTRGSRGSQARSAPSMRPPRPRAARARRCRAGRSVITLTAPPARATVGWTVVPPRGRRASGRTAPGGRARRARWRRRRGGCRRGRGSQEVDVVVGDALAADLERAVVAGALDDEHAVVALAPRPRSARGWRRSRSPRPRSAAASRVRRLDPGASRRRAATIALAMPAFMSTVPGP
jgi:hypothetical protein